MQRVILLSFRIFGVVVGGLLVVVSNYSRDEALEKVGHRLEIFKISLNVAWPKCGRVANK